MCLYLLTLKNLRRILLHKQLWLFDMDGTLFQTERVAIEAFREVFVKLRHEGVQVPENVMDEQITGIFGYTHDRLWAQLFGRGLTVEEQVRADDLLLGEEVRLIHSGRGALYPDVKETLLTLKERGATLAVASNGLSPYIEAIVDYYELRELFVGLYSAGGYHVNSKVDLVRIACAEIPHERGMMVGDRFTDVEAGLKNGLEVIGCAFGFAQEDEFRDAHRIVKRFSEILTMPE